MNPPVVPIHVENLSYNRGWKKKLRPISTLKVFNLNFISRSTWRISRIHKVEGGWKNNIQKSPMRTEGANNSRFDEGDGKINISDKIGMKARIIAIAMAH